MMVASDRCQELGIGGAISLLWFRLAVDRHSAKPSFEPTEKDVPHSSLTHCSSRDLALMQPGAMLCRSVGQEKTAAICLQVHRAMCSG